MPQPKLEVAGSKSRNVNRYLEARAEQSILAAQVAQATAAYAFAHDHLTGGQRAEGDKLWSNGGWSDAVETIIRTGKGRIVRRKK